MKRILVIVILLMLPVFSYAADKYKVSMKDVNRIICPEEITEVVFSEEKGLISKVSGRELFIKFPVTITIDQETGSKNYDYSNEDAEVFIVCGETYNLNLKPAKILSQTITIEPKIGQISEFKGKDAEELLGALMTLAIERSLPVAFKVSEKNISHSLSRGDMTLNVIYKKVSVGGGYLIREYQIYSGNEITLTPLELVSFPDVTKPLAISLTSETFKGWIRGFVIEAAQ